MPRVVFTPSGIAGIVDSGTTVLAAARQLGVDLDTVCGGRGICGRCQVVPSPGVHAKWGIDVAPTALSPPAMLENDYRGHRPLLDGNRLGCSATIAGDVVVDVPAASQVHRQVVRKSLDHDLAFEVDPAFRLWYVELETIADGSVVGVLRRSMVAQHGVDIAGVAPRLLATLRPVIDAGAGSVTVAVGDDDVVVAVWPGYVDTAYGIAVDVGSTTVAAHLCDLTSGDVVATSGRMNPQIRFGEDLMSRVSYVMMNPGGDAALTSVIRAAIDELAGELLDDAGVARGAVLDLVLVGNPVMHHLVLGLDPTPLGQAPFTLATDEPVRLRAVDLDINLPNAAAYVGPCIAGHVGADAAAAMLAEGPHRGDGMQLLVDIGTNAEIVLGDCHHQFAASSPTGPAFEGAQISSGQRATTGAVERVRIDPGTLEPRVKVIGTDEWSDERGFETAVRAAGGVTGVCGSGIIDAIAEMVRAGIIDAKGTIRGEVASRSSRIVADGRTFSYVLYDGAAVSSSRLMVTQQDVRAIQLAKAALRAGIELLVEHAGRPAIHDVRLAGAFGAHVDPERALVVGLVPGDDPSIVRSVGNAAGRGAVQALLSKRARAEMEGAVRRVVKIETATEPRFQELFVAALAFAGAPAASDTTAPRRRRQRSVLCA